jgi:hypothetical protein
MIAGRQHHRLADRQGVEPGARFDQFRGEADVHEITGHQRQVGALATGGACHARERFGAQVVSPFAPPGQKSETALAAQAPRRNVTERTQVRGR